MMFRSLRRRIRTHRREDVTPEADAAFLDSSNLPGFNRAQLEGRLVRPLTLREIWTVGVLFGCMLIAALVQGYRLQIVHYNEYVKRAENNRFEKQPLFANRGIITDRFGTKLAWNEPNPTTTTSGAPTFAARAYDESPAFSHVLGYVREPKKDKQGNWWRTSFEAHGGIEGYFNDTLSGTNGAALYEVDATRTLASFAALEPAQDGAPVTLSIDADLTKELYAALKSGGAHGFIGGAGVVMDIDTGEIIAMTSYPSFSVNAFAHPKTDTKGTSEDKKQAISRYLTDPAYPLLDRVYQGAYLPGSIVKPYMAIGALEEGVITPEEGIVSTGKLVIPNPYHPDKPSIFKDWKAHGWVDMRHAIAVSSDVYFYEVGGGFGAQRGMGIQAIDTWMGRFGFGTKTGFLFEGEQAGNVPTPEWKTRAFAEDPTWNIGNTYHSSIGQYGWLVTPLQAVRALTALANGGTLLTPTIIRTEHTTTTDAQKKRIPFSDAHMQVVHEGMRLATQIGTTKALNIRGIEIAGKTGTAEVGAHKEKMNSWVMGFWPYEKPKFAFVVMLEKAPAGTLRGAAPAMRDFFQKLVDTRSPYVKGEYPEKKKEEETSASTGVKEGTKKDDTRTMRDPNTQTVEESIPIPQIPAFVPN